MKATVAAVCFVVDDRRVLLLQRNHGAFLGKWDGPGGLVEFGESPAEAARRELLEETGVQVEGCEQRAHLLLYNVENGSATSSHLFVAARWSGEVTEGVEGRAEWVPLDRLKETNLIDFMQITLPLVLTPGSLLIGSIHHNASGAPVRYELEHHRLGEARVLRGPGQG